MHLVRHGTLLAAASTAQTQSAAVISLGALMDTEPKRIASLNGHNETQAEAAVNKTEACNSSVRRSGLSR